jgi:hypothetical protein
VTRLALPVAALAGVAGAFEPLPHAVVGWVVVAALLLVVPRLDGVRRTAAWVGGVVTVLGARLLSGGWAADGSLSSVAVVVGVAALGAVLATGRARERVSAPDAMRQP